MQAQQWAIRNRSFASRFLHLETKAYEMSAMCEAEIALISYRDDGLRKIRGHPSVPHVVNRYCADVAVDAAEANAAVYALFLLLEEHPPVAVDFDGMVDAELEALESQVTNLITQVQARLPA